MMKNIIATSSGLAAFVLAAGLLTACGSSDELVPIDRQSSSLSRYYKLPDPEALSTTERATVESIRTEYEQQTK